MTDDERILEVCLHNLVLALEEATDAGCIDHLDCMDDGGEAFHTALSDAKQALRK